MKEPSPSDSTDRPNVNARSRWMFAFANQFALRCRVFFFDVRLFGTAIKTTAPRVAHGASAVVGLAGANAATCDSAVNAASAVNVFIVALASPASSGAASG